MEPVSSAAVGPGDRTHRRVRQPYDLSVTAAFHVSSVANRASIAEHGLDSTRMGAAPGIAGSRKPEVEGCFVCVDEWEVEWFASTINNTGGPVDVWEVEGLTAADLIESPSGHHWFPGTIPSTRVRLHRAGT